jgi:hypothetical protein
MNKPFAIIQNDRTRQTFLRVGTEMVEADESEFDSLQVLAIHMRMAKDPIKFMDKVVAEWRNEIAKEDAEDEDKIPPIPGFFISPEELDGLEEDNSDD